jgi:hypothetical protein
MKTSDLIKQLQDEIKEFGDSYILSFKLMDENGVTERYKYSPTRRDSDGERRKMSWKEFEQYVKEQKSR